jgi:transcriptional regulator with XRE-family HTH domain
MVGVELRFFRIEQGISQLDLGGVSKLSKKSGKNKPLILFEGRPAILYSLCSRQMLVRFDNNLIIVTFTVRRQIFLDLLVSIQAEFDAYFRSQPAFQTHKPYLLLEHNVRSHASCRSKRQCSARTNFGEGPA